MSSEDCRRKTLVLSESRELIFRIGQSSSVEIYSIIVSGSEISVSRYSGQIKRFFMKWLKRSHLRQNKPVKRSSTGNIEKQMAAAILYS